MPENKTVTFDATLLPCPFCGCENILTVADEYGSGGQHVPPYHIVCRVCKTEQSDDDLEAAREKWNTRFVKSSAYGGYAGHWQTIDTAPRDGTSILIRFGNDGVSQARYVIGSSHPWRFIDTRDGMPWMVNNAVDSEYGPTHWMPMPDAAPTPAAQSAGKEAVRYFVYDNEYGYNEFKTDAERDSAHRSAIEGYLDDGWSEEVESVVSGIVTHITVECNIEHAPPRCEAHPEQDGDDCSECAAWNEWPNHEYDYTCSYEPDALAGAPVNGGERPPIEYRYEGGTHWCPLGPAEHMKPDFKGVYRLMAGTFPVWQGDEHDMRDEVTKALGLPIGGIRDGKPVSFAWSYLLGQIEQLVLLAERYAEESKCPGCEGKPAPQNNPCVVCGKRAAEAKQVGGDRDAIAELIGRLEARYGNEFTFTRRSGEATHHVGFDKHPLVGKAITYLRAALTSPAKEQK